MRGLGVVLAVGACLLAGLAAWALQGVAGSSGPAVADGHSAVPEAAQGVVSRALGRADRRFFVHRVRGGFALGQGSAGLLARFSRDGVVVGAGSVAWSLGLRGVGRGGQLVPAGSVAPAAHGNVVEYSRRRVSEWYANGPLGLEQGFTLNARPAGAAAAPLTIALGEVPRTLGVGVSSDRRSVVLTRAARVLVRYRGLFASDGGGRALPAWIEVSGHRLSLQVDDRGARYPVRVDPFVQAGKLTASDGAAGDGLGSAVAVSDDAVAVGAPSAGAGRGAVYVFVRPAGGWADATQTAKLAASDGVGNDLLGSSVAMSGDTIVAGAPHTTIAGRQAQGAAYVFTKPPGGWTDGTESSKLTAADGATSDQFGSSVAIDGSTIVVGAQWASPNAFFGAGAAYVFVDGVQQAKLLAVNGQPEDNFGSSVGVSGGTVAVGAAGARNFAGSVYVFVKPAGGWANATPTATLTASDSGQSDHLGISAGVSGDTVAAGATSATVGGRRPGAVYVFVKPAGGWSDGTQTAKLTASDGVGGDDLGWSLTFAGDTIAAGAPGAGGNFQGAIYTFAKPAGGWTDEAESDKLTASDEAGGDGFGEAAAITSDGATLVGGSPGSGAGAAYVFTSGAGAGARPTFASVSCAPDSITVGQATNCTATVNDVGSGDTVTPTGSVTFSSDSHGTFSDPGDTCTLAATGTTGRASCQASYTANSADSGTHTITGSYAGDGGHSGSSGRTAVSVAPAAKRTSLTSVGCAPDAVTVGHGTTCTATVTDAAPGFKTAPTGSVTLGSDSPGSFSNPGSTCTLTPAGSGTSTCQASYAPSAIGSGTHAINASYDGDASHSGSNGTATVTVSAPLPPAHAQARFGLATPGPQVFQPIQLDASGSVRPGSQVISYSWSVTGNHYALNTSTACSGQTPVLQTVIARPGTYQATVHVTDSLGGTSSYTQSFRVAGHAPTADTAAAPGGLAGRILRAGNRYAQALASAPPIASCNPSGSPNRSLDTTAGGGPPAGCYSQIEESESLVRAVGCFTEASLAELPLPEKRIVDLAIYHCRICALADLPADKRAHVIGLGALGSADAGAAAVSLGGQAQLKRAVSTVTQLVQRGTVFYVSTQPVRINGLDYTPAPGAAVVIASPGFLDADLRPYVISSNVAISAATDLLGTLTMRSGELELPIDTDREQIAYVPFNQSVAFLPGTNLDGGIHVQLRQDSSDLVTEMALPDIFRLSTDENRRVTVGITLTATNDAGVRITGFRLDNLDANIYGLVHVSIAHLSYDARRSAFEADGVTVDMFDAIGKISAGLGIQGKHVTHFEIAYDFPPPGIEVAPAIHLAELSGFWIDNDQQTAFGGGATLTLGPAVDGCGIAGVKGGFEFQLFPLYQVTVTGDVSLACIPVGHEVVTIAEDGYAHFGASIDYELIKDVVSLSGSFDVTYFSGHFTAIADVQACAGVCAGATGVISDKGLGVCLSITTDFGFHWHPGFGFDWPPPAVLAGGPVTTAAGILANLHLISDSCGTGPWVTVNPRARDAQAGRAAFVVPREQQGAVLSVVGADHAPRLRVSGPSGQTIDTPAQGVLNTGRAVAFSNPATRTTYIALFRPHAGPWTLQSLDGSPIVTVRRGSILADPRVSGRVTGSGSTRLLRYQIKVPAGDDVRLFERAPGGTRQLAVVRRGGQLRFTPSDAGGSRRAILALVERHGMPVTQLTIARFQASPPAIGRARAIHARRRRGSVVVSWVPASGAQSQVVGFVLSDGRSYEVTTGPRTRSLRIGAVLHGERLLVLVSARRAHGSRRGPVAQARFRIA